MLTKWIQDNNIMSKGGYKMLIDRKEIIWSQRKLHISNEEMAKKLGICRTSYLRKLNGSNSFTEDEIVELVKVAGKDIFILP
mgnify:CR=1 FL=1